MSRLEAFLCAKLIGSLLGLLFLFFVMRPWLKRQMVDDDK